MSDEPNENSSPEENMPPAQENFGPPFPEEAPVSPPQPPMYENSPDPFYGMPPYGTPPYGYDGLPGGTYGAPYGPGVPPRASNPLPLGEAIRQLPRQYWRVLTRPGAATFAEEQGKAAWNIVWVQLFVLGAIQALAILVIFNISLPFQLSMFTGGMSNTPGAADPTEIVHIYRIISIPLALGSLVITPLLALGGTGINHLIAKLFRG